MIHRALPKRDPRTVPGTAIIAVDDDYLWVQFQTPLFRFIDDVEMKLARENDEIDIRSRSRVGYSDLGRNRKRVEEIRTLWRGWRKSSSG